MEEELKSAFAVALEAKDHEIAQLTTVVYALSSALVSLFCGGWLFVKARLNRADERAAVLERQVTALLKAENA